MHLAQQQWQVCKKFVKPPMVGLFWAPKKVYVRAKSQFWPTLEAHCTQHSTLGDMGPVSFCSRPEYSRMVHWVGGLEPCTLHSGSGKFAKSS